MRQEGLGVAVKQRVSPRRRAPSDTSDGEEEERANSIQPEHCNGYGESREESHPPISVPSQTEPLPSSQTEGRFDRVRGINW